MRPSTDRWSGATIWNVLGNQKQSSFVANLIWIQRAPENTTLSLMGAPFQEARFDFDFSVARADAVLCQLYVRVCKHRSGLMRKKLPRGSLIKTLS